MGYQHGRFTVITVDGDVVKCNSSALTRKRKTHETPGYGDDAVTRDPGLADNAFTMGGIYDNTVSTGSRAVLQPLVDAGAKVEITRAPEGTGSGKPLETFTGILASYVETSPVDGMVTWSCDVDIDGEVVPTTQGA